MTTTRYECSECGGWIRSEGGEGDDPYDRDNVDTSETCGGCATDDAGEWTDLECGECGSALLQGEVSSGGLCMGCQDYAEEEAT